MLKWIRSGRHKTSEELEIMNSNPYYNKLFSGRAEVELAELEKELSELQGSDRHRYLIEKDGKGVAILEYILHNPKDGKPWLGLLMVHHAFQKQGIAEAVYLMYEKKMKSIGLNDLRLGVLDGNEPARFFWAKMGFGEVEAKEQEGKKIHIFEKRLAPDNNN